MTAQELNIETRYEFETKARSRENAKTISDILQQMDKQKKIPAFFLDYGPINDVVKYYFEARGFQVLTSESNSTFTWDSPKSL